MEAAHFPRVSFYGRRWDGDLQSMKCLTEGFLQTFGSENNSAQLAVQSDQPGVKQPECTWPSWFSCFLPSATHLISAPVSLGIDTLSWHPSVEDRLASRLGNGQTVNTEESCVCVLDCSPSKTVPV